MASIFFLNDISYMVEMYNNIRADGTHQLVNIKTGFCCLIMYFLQYKCDKIK